MYYTYGMNIFDFLLHIDQYLQNSIQHIGILGYVLLFLIIFAETGLVVIPFLPGDSLLFAAGALAAGGLIDVRIVIPLLIAAAIIGDSVNYWIGSRMGERVFSNKNARFFKPVHLAKTQDFFEKHGGKTIILARFLPIIRTFAPFVAGVGNMRYQTFLAYNVIGGVIWVTSLTLAGYFFGNIPIIKDNFEYIVIAIVVVSFVPAIIESIKYFRPARQTEIEPTSYKDIQETFHKK